MALTWRRDSQGLWAHDTSEMLAYYVRRTASGCWRAAWGDLVTVAGITVADVARPMTTIDVADRQATAKAIAQAFADQPWSDGSAQSRATRAIQAGYAATA